MENGRGEWPDMSRIFSTSAALDESLSVVYDNRDGMSSCLPSQTAYASNLHSTYNSQQSAQESSAAESQSEEEMEDEDEEDILNWVAQGLLPANNESTLALNQAYQEILEQFIHRVEGILTQVRERQASVQSVLDKHCNASAISKITKVQPSIYMNPYFRDSAEMCPPINPEAKRRLEELDGIDLLVEPPLKWSSSEEKRLTDAVTENVMQKRLMPLLNKKELISEKLSANTNESNNKKLRKELMRADKEYCKLAKSTNDQFPDNFDWNLVDWNFIHVDSFDCARTALECRLKWINELRPGINHNSAWRKDEISKLKKLAELNCYKNWDKVADKLGTGRTAFQCAEKYHSELNDVLKISNWTDEDDQALRDAVDKVRMGDYIPWDQVLLFMDNRTRVQCKTRYSRVLDPQLRKGRWTEDEDLLLVEAVEKCGEKNWPKIASYIPGRIESQCRERWHSCLKMNIKSEPWTKEDDAKLLLGISTFGAGNWAHVCGLLPGRSANACKVHYRTLQRRGIQRVSQLKQDGETPAESRALTVRRHLIAQRKELVRQAYVENHGRAPKFMQVEDTSTNSFIKTLPPEIQKVVREKLVAIKSLYGNSSLAPTTTEEPSTSAKVIRVSVRQLNNEKKVKEKSAAEKLNTNQIKKIIVGAEKEEQRMKKVDTEIMTLLRNSTSPAGSSFPFTRFKAKESSMRKTLVQCLSDKKVLPPSKSTLLGFKGLLLERQELLAKAKRLNGVNPLVKSSDQVLRGYLDDKEQPGTSKDNVSTEDKEPVGEENSDLNMKDFLAADSIKHLVNNATFIETENQFRSMFLWPAIMASFKDASSNSTVLMDK